MPSSTSDDLSQTWIPAYDPILGSCPTCSSLVPYLGWRCTHKGPGFIGCPVCSGICSVDLVYPPA